MKSRFYFLVIVVPQLPHGFPGGVGGEEELSFGGLDFYVSSYISQFYIIHGVSPPVFVFVVSIIGKGVGQKLDSHLFREKGDPKSFTGPAGLGPQ